MFFFRGTFFLIFEDCFLSWLVLFILDLFQVVYSFYIWNLYNKYFESSVSVLFLGTTRTQKLMNIQNKIVRLMTFQSFQTHIEQIFIDLQVLNINKLNNYLTSLFMFWYRHLNNLPISFNNFFITNNKIHKHKTRNSSNLHKPHERTNYVKYSLSVQGINIWNNLDRSLTTISALSFFKKKSKIYFLYIHMIWSAQEPLRI